MSVHRDIDQPMPEGRRSLRAILARRCRERRTRDRQSGVALLVTISALSLLIALVANFSYDTTIDVSQAVNARDELRAHYLARSAMELSRMLIKIQLKFVEPVMATAQKMLADMAGQDLGISLRVTDYTGPLLGFFGGNPFALGNLPDFLNGLAIVLHHYTTEQPGFEGTANWRWYPRAFLTSADALWVVGGAVGLVGILWREWRKGLLLLVFPLFYYLMVSRFTVRFERNMVPLLPFLAVGGGWLLDAGADWLARRFRRDGRVAYGLAALGAIVMLALPLAASISFDALLSQTDRREMAGQWVEENIPEGSKIAIEHYSIPFDYDKYDVQDVIRISDHTLDWYQQEGFDALIISDGVWAVLRRQPEAYADKLAVYDELAAESRLLAEFVSQPPALVVAGYPTVAVYHFAPVRIYSVHR